MSSDSSDTDERRLLFRAFIAAFTVMLTLLPGLIWWPLLVLPLSAARFFGRRIYASFLPWRAAWPEAPLGRFYLPVILGHVLGGATNMLVARRLLERLYG